MAELQVCIGDGRIERQRPSVGGLRAGQLFRVAQLAQFLQGVTVLHPNRRISGISVESLPVELSGELPLPRVSGAVGKRDGARPAAPQTKARHQLAVWGCRLAPLAFR